MWIPLTVVAGDRRADLHVRCTPTATVDDLRAALAERLQLADPGELSVDGRRPAAGDRLAAAGVRAGATVCLGPARQLARAPEPRRVLEGVAGPDGGLIIALPETGTISIGRDASNTVVLADTAVSRRHAIVACTPGEVVVRDAGSANGTEVNGTVLIDAQPLTAGAVVQVGDNQLRFRAGPDAAPAAKLVRQPDGSDRLDRPQRFTEPPVVREVRLPRKPPDRSRSSAGIGWAALSSLVLGVVAYFVFHSFTFLLLAAASTATLLISALVSYVRARREQARAAGRHAAEHAAAEAEIEALVVAERTARRRATPGPADVVAIARRPGPTLWERRPTHPDFLEVRIGIAALPSRVTVRDPDGGTTVPDVRDVPLTVSLTVAGTVGLAGPFPAARAVARWIVLQAVVQSGPADLRVVVLTAPGDRAAQAGWDWVRWLPHARPENGPLASVGADALSLQGRIDELAALVAQRRQAGDGGTAAPRRLLVVDGLSANDVPGLAELLQAGPDAGISVVAVGELPYRCPVTVTFQDSANVTVQRAGESPRPDVVADQIGVEPAETAARGIAALRDPQSAGGMSGLPERVALLDDHDGAGDPAAIARRWRGVPRRTDIVVGRAADGPLAIDLAANGPHAIVAGATGWGKSAFLQTLVAGLALANRPDELGFLLIDFKGGAAFAPFVTLPHVMGMITNLDGRAVMRALDSLAGEILRRQVYLREAGVEKLAEYQRLAAAGALPDGCPPRLPRMCIVVDEFAILREKLSDDILRRLVHVATQGRSIGLHLILGTQTPRGAVPPEIAENAKLRIALHLSADHSQDVVGTPDARLITVPGRGLVRRGQEADVVVFQSAYVGGRTRRVGGPPVRVLRAAFDELGREPAGEEVAEVRDADILVRAVAEAAAAAGIGRPELPWLPELPARLDAAGLSSSSAPALPYGREDRPEERRQPVAEWDLDAGTHLLAAGRPRSGRSTLLRTLAAAIAKQPADRVHLYVMDCGGALADLRDLPQCGAYLDQSELARGARLLDRLEALVSGGPAAARTVLFIDDWDSWVQTFGEVDGGALHEQLMRVVRKGPAAGLHVAVTGGSTLFTSARARALNEASQDRLALAFDAEDYGWIGVPATARPAEPRPGLAVRLGAPHRAVQVAVLSQPLRAPARGPEKGGPWPVDALPSRVGYPEAAVLPRGTGPAWIGLGVGGDRLQWLGADAVREGPAVFVAGERHSGRSTTLLAIALDALDRGVPVVAVAPSRGSVLHELTGVAGVAAVLGARQPTDRQIGLAIAAAGAGPCLVVIDDAEQLQNSDGGRALHRMMLAEDAGRAFVVAADLAVLSAPAPNSLLGEAGRGGTGLVLTPRSARVHLFGVLTRLPEAYVSSEPPGRAVLLRRSAAAPVQVPYASSADVRGRARRSGSVAALLQVTDVLAGPAPTPAGRLCELIDRLRAAGFDELAPDAAQRAVAWAPGWDGTPEDLVAAAR
ncbi:FtsK/SpoIIIE domain-containing protein [Actinoplanes sichuanensis]|uniref:FtsK/SpoIIIE domain-containing protein n=1 Tax=Actinoplanes sichuanensis TaxID=512349 RepID=A0ABW4A0B7_9ACTN|nr:FtsK/SpoIIIE domain-containing protein [Actinoplanes sichuanensis]BEL04225.1 FtsK/SpoIIIE domain-containing protein [Actinoplanes sichuanensis]